MSCTEQEPDGNSRRLYETLWGAVLESPAQGVLAVDERGVIHFANRFVERLFRYGDGELAGKLLDDLIPDRLKQSHQGHHGVYFQSPAVRQMGNGREITGRCQDGTEVPIEVALSPVAKRDQQVFVVAFVSDIASRKQQEVALRESEARLARMSAASEDGFFEWDVNTGKVFSTERWKTITGHRLDTEVTALELIGWLGAMDGKAERNCRTCDFIEEIGCANRIAGEVQRIGHDGRPVWIWARALVSARGPGGRPELISGAITNISDQKVKAELLRQSESRFSIAASIAHVGVGEIDIETDTVTCSYEASRILGVSFGGRLKMSHLMAVIHSSDRQSAMRILYSRSSDSDRIEPQEIRIVWPNGEDRWVLLSPQISTLAQSPGGDLRRIAFAVLDITEQKLAQQALEMSRESMRIAVEAVGVGAWRLDLTMQTIEVSEVGRKLLGIAEMESLDLAKLIACVHSEERELLEQYLDQLAGDPSVVDFEFRRATELDSSQDCWLAIKGRMTHTDDSERKVLFGIIQDVSMRKRYEARFRELSGQMLKAQEEERKRLAREIHDGVTQDLALVGIRLGLLRQKPEAQELATAISEIEDQLLKLNDDLRLLSHEFHPRFVEHVGLSAALEAHCREVASCQRFDLQFEANVQTSMIPAEVGLALFRIAQEALRNTIKHAQASNVLVRLEMCSAQRKEAGFSCDNRMVKLTVADDGRGFEPNDQAESLGLGMFSMAERARLIDASFTVRSSPETGTRIELQAPLRMEKDSE